MKPSTEQANSSETTPEQMEEKLLTESSENTSSPTQTVRTNPFSDPCFNNVTDSEEGGIIIIGAPPPPK